MSDFGIKNMDQVAPVCNMYRGLLKVSSEKQGFFVLGSLISTQDVLLVQISMKLWKFSCN